MALAASPGQADAVLSVANAMMATARPTPAWAVQGVLLSPDLLSQTFKHLDLGSFAAASVCSEWRRQWKSMLVEKRILMKVVQTLPMSRPMNAPVRMAVLPDGHVCVTLQNKVDYGAGEVAVFECNDGVIGQKVNKCTVPFPYGVAVLDGAVYMSNPDPQFVARCHFQDGQLTVASQRDVDFCPLTMVAKDDLLYVIAEFDVQGEDEDEDAWTITQIVSLDRDLNEVARFPLPDRIFDLKDDGHGARQGLASHGAHLFVVSTSCSQIFVFSTAGQLVKTIAGDFGCPSAISIFDDRIYLLSCRPDTDDDDADYLSEVHVLSIEGCPTQPPLRLPILLRRKGQHEQMEIFATKERVYVSDWEGKRLFAIAFAT